MRKSIRTRALILVFLTLFIVLGANTFILTLGYLSYQKTDIRNKTTLIGEHLLDKLGRVISLGIPLDSIDGLNETCHEIVDVNKELGYCMLVDPSGRVLYHNDPIHVGRFLKDDASLKAASSSEAGFMQSRTEDGKDFFDVAIPILNPDKKLMGSIRIGIKKDYLSSQIWPLLFESSMVAAITFLLASGLVTFFVRNKIIIPMEELTRTAALIAQGDLTRRLAITSGDEVGQLASSFNQMAESLQEREARIAENYADLEKANEELQSSYRKLEMTAGELEMKSLSLKEKVNELSFLHDATDRVRASIELEDILSSVARDVTEGLGYDRVVVALVDERTKTIEEKTRLGFDPDGQKLSVSLEDKSVFAKTVSDGKTQYIAQASLDSRVPIALVEAFDLNEFALIPMVGKDKCVGLMLVDNRRSYRTMRRDKLDILAIFASTAAMAVENAYLYRQLMGNLDTVEKANRELRKLDETKTNFLSLASHELRTPLVSVMGYLNLMLAGDLGEINEEQREMLQIAVKGAVRLKDIIEDLLMVAKIEGGRLVMKLKWISMSDVLASSIEEVSPFLHQRSIRLKTEGVDLLPKLEADFDRLQQLFTNIIGNAIKFTPDGGGVTISGRKVKVDKEKGKLKPVTFDNSILSSDTYLEISVEDTGIGISKENLDKIFDKFYEVGDVDMHSTGKAKFRGGGTGLGLSIVKGVCEAHNGSVWAESDGEDVKLCPGSRFIVLLPIKQPSARAELPRIVSEAAARTASRPPARAAGVRPRVLLIEDDEDIVSFTKLILDKKFQVDVATDGFEGIKKAFSDKPSVILLDVWMHGIDGYEVCKLLKGSERTADVPVAMFTAAAQKHEMERGYAAGADDYITKPFTPAELMARIEKLMGSGAEVA